LAERGDHEGFAAALERLVSDAGLRTQVVRGARAHVNETFTWDAMVGGNLAVYDAV
jgi:glycosyltransferase involved in cell wall biosynthesis